MLIFSMLLCWECDRTGLAPFGGAAACCRHSANVSPGQYRGERMRGNVWGVWSVITLVVISDYAAQLPMLLPEGDAEGGGVTDAAIENLQFISCIQINFARTQEVAAATMTTTTSSLPPLLTGCARCWQSLCPCSCPCLLELITMRPAAAADCELWQVNERTNERRRLYRTYTEYTL